MKVKLLKKIRRRFKIVFITQDHPDCPPLQYGVFKIKDKFDGNDHFLGSSYDTSGYENTFQVHQQRDYEIVKEMATDQLKKFILSYYREYGKRRKKAMEFKMKINTKLVWHEN